MPAPPGGGARGAGVGAGPTEEGSGWFEVHVAPSPSCSDRTVCGAGGTRRIRLPAVVGLQARGCGYGVPRLVPPVSVFEDYSPYYLRPVKDFILLASHT